MICFKLRSPQCRFSFLCAFWFSAVMVCVFPIYQATSPPPSPVCNQLISSDLLTKLHPHLQPNATDSHPPWCKSATWTSGLLSNGFATHLKMLLSTRSTLSQYATVRLRQNVKVKSIPPSCCGRDSSTFQQENTNPFNWHAVMKTHLSGTFNAPQLTAWHVRKQAADGLFLSSAKESKHKRQKQYRKDDA